MAFKEFCSLLNVEILLSKENQLKSDEYIDNIIKILLQNDIQGKLRRVKKSDQISKNYREEGNKYFNNNQNNDYKSIFLIYTKALFNAETIIEKSFGYGNRSSILFKMGLYKASINDIDSAIKCNYPLNLIHKLLVRKAEAFIMLDEFENAKKILSGVQLNLKFFEDNTHRWSTRIISGINKCASKSKYNTYLENVELLQIYPIATFDMITNDKISAFSQKVQLNVNDYDGRGIFARSSINIGDIIAVETPYTYRLSVDNMTTHCYYCLKINYNLMACNNCCQVGFCNDECLKQAITLNRHGLECGLMTEILSTYSKELGLLAYGIISKTDLNSVRSSLDYIKDENLRNKNVVINSEEYLSALSVETNEHLRKPEDLFQRCISAVFLAQCLATMSMQNENSFSNSQYLKTISEVILKHLQGIPCNAHSMGENTIPFNGTLVEAFTNYTGNALYPALSMINHSCSPNVVRVTMSKGVCILKASRYIDKEEQIFDNYSIHFATMPKEERQKNLQEQYYFECCCRACEENWPTFDEQLKLSEVIHFKCPKCQNKVSLKNENCLSCQLCLKEYFDKFKSFNGCLSQKMNLILQHQLSGIEEYLKEFSTLLFNIVEPPHILFHQTAEMLKLIWTLEGSSVSSF